MLCKSFNKFQIDYITESLPNLGHADDAGLNVFPVNL